MGPHTQNGSLASVRIRNPDRPACRLVTVLTAIFLPFRMKNTLPFMRFSVGLGMAKVL